MFISRRQKSRLAYKELILGEEPVVYFNCLFDGMCLLLFCQPRVEVTSCFVYKVMGLTFHHSINTQFIYKIEIAQVRARRITKPQRTFSRFESHWLLFSFFFHFFWSEGGGLILLFCSCLIFFIYFLFFLLLFFIFYHFNIYKVHI